jgi:hypothetical protein
MNYRRRNALAGPASAGSTIRPQFDWETSNLFAESELSARPLGDGIMIYYYNY